MFCPLHDWTANIVLLLWFAISPIARIVYSDKEIFRTNQRLDWEAAANYCRVNNGSLLSYSSDIDIDLPQNESPGFWVSRYDTSAWIRIVGCYFYRKDKYTNGTVIPNVTVGLCERHCRESINTYFGIKDDTCYCVSEIFPTDYTTFENCIQTCTGDPNDLCGGSFAVSIYAKENREILNRTCQMCDCVTLQCQDKEPVLEATKCYSRNAALCRNNENFEEDNVIQNITGYELSKVCDRYGLSLGINETVCNSSFELPRWIGVVRKTVDNFDSNSIDQEGFTRCWHCHLKNGSLNCQSGDCSEALDVICELFNVADTAVTEITESPATDPPHQNHLELDLDSLVIGVILSVVIPVCSVIIVIFVMQRKRTRRTSRGSLEDKDSAEGGTVPTEHAYYVVEPQGMYVMIDNKFPADTKTFNNATYATDNPGKIQEHDIQNENTCPSDYAYCPPKEGEYDELGKCKLERIQINDLSEYSGLEENDYSVTLTTKLKISSCTDTSGSMRSQNEEFS